MATTAKAWKRPYTELTGADDDGVKRAVIDQLIEADDYWPPDGGEPFYQEDFDYEQNDSPLTVHSNRWVELCHDLLHGQRFFNLKASQTYLKFPA